MTHGKRTRSSVWVGAGAPQDTKGVMMRGIWPGVPLGPLLALGHGHKWRYMVFKNKNKKEI